MTKRIFWLGLCVGLLGMLWLGAGQARAEQAGQAPTPTLADWRIQINDPDGVNVRAGPGTDYDKVGRLIQGQNAPILGQVETTGVWLKIYYVGGPNNEGWVTKDLVKVIGDLAAVPQVAVPPTPTRPAVATLPVLVETGTPAAARLPTFTPPAFIARPTLPPAQGAVDTGGFPPAIIIVSLLVLGGFGLMLSMLRGR